MNKEPIKYLTGSYTLFICQEDDGHPIEFFANILMDSDWGVYDCPHTFDTEDEAVDWAQKVIIARDAFERAMRELGVEP